METFKVFFRLQKCLSRKSSLSRKNSQIFSPAKLSQPQIINNLEIFKDFFTCRIVLAANDQQHGNIQTFSTCRTLLAANHQQPGKSQRHFHRQKYLSQIINNMETFKVFFACRFVLAADHRCPGNIQTLFHLQICPNRKSSTTWKNSKTFSPADLTWPQVIDTPKKFKDIFTCRIVLAAIDQQHGNIQIFSTSRIRSRKTSTTWKQSTTFSPAEISQSQIINNMETFKVFFACRNFLAPNHLYSEKIQRFFRLQNCLRRRSSIPRKYANSFSPADMS